MNNDETEPARSAVPAIAAAIIDSFLITHSIIITVIVAVSALAALSRVREFTVCLETTKDLETGFHDGACQAAYLIARRTGGAMSFDRSEAAERWSQKKRLDRPCPRLDQTREPTWRPS